MCIPLEIDRQTGNCTNREALKDTDTHITVVYDICTGDPNGCARGLQTGPDMILTSV